MSDKAFRQLPSTFHAAEAVHPFMKWIERCLRLLASMSQTGGSLAALGHSDVDISSWMKLLCLLTLIHFEIVKIKFPAAFDPSVVNQQRNRSMVPMGIDWPMGENYFWTFVLQKFSESLIAGPIYFRTAIDLSGKYRPCFQDRTSLLAFR